MGIDKKYTCISGSDNIITIKSVLIVIVRFLILSIIAPSTKQQPFPQ